MFKFMLISNPKQKIIVFYELKQTESVIVIPLSLDWKYYP